ncbi:MAG: DUF4381 family protein [Lysobacteraceae bacterium]
MMPDGPQLADLHLPAPPSWWPPAPGWWLLALLLLALSFWLWQRLRRRHKQRARRDFLQAELESLSQRFPGENQGAAQVAALSVSLRRIAREVSPGAERLQGQDWLEFLDAGDALRPFSQGEGRLLLDAPYRAQVPAEQARALLVMAQRNLPRWLERADA